MTVSINEEGQVDMQIIDGRLILFYKQLLHSIYQFIFRGFLIRLETILILN